MARQNSKEEQHINVSVRIRPYTDSETESKCSSFLEILSKKEIISKSNYNQKRYIFDRVFDSYSSQLEVYNAIVAPLIPEVIGGYNCTVFAYGQTGTGKTYTMEGIHNTDNQINSGIIPRALTHIFKVLSNMNIESSVKVSYLELYNEELFDLLSQSSLSKAIRIYEDKTQKGSVILQGLEELSVTEISQIYKILEQGAEKRRIASTYINNASSRSHAVFIIVVHTREITVDGEELVKTGKLNLVDLAGSENISKSGAVDKRAREAGSINQSLLTLGRVIKALTERNTHVPYRESKLTRILQDSLGGRTKTSLIATVSSANVNMEETLNTLEYAMRARCIQNRPELNQKISRTALINQYSDTIEKLQRDLTAMRTGTGVFVDEDNYTKLVTDVEVQKLELNEKTTQIKKLEAEISEYSDKLHILQENWTEAANNVERLLNENRILDKDLILVKEISEKRSQQLQNVKQKHKQLRDETHKLLTDVQIHAQNEDTLHKKVSYLYQTSYTNKDITDAFYNMYSKLYVELISNIDKCICLALRFLDEKIVSKSGIEQGCNLIKSNVDELLQMSVCFREYKVKHFNNKQKLESRFHGYYDMLESLVSDIQEKSITFCDKLEENLHSLSGLVTTLLEKQSSDLISIMPNLVKMREMAVRETSYFSNILQQLHYGIMENINDLTTHIEKLSDINKNNYAAMVTIQQKFDEDLSRLKTEFSASMLNCRKQQETAINYGADINEKLNLFRQSTDASISTYKEESSFKFDTLRNSVETTIAFLNQIEDNAEAGREGITKPIEKHVCSTLNIKNDICRNFQGSKEIVNAQGKHIADLECVDDEHYTNLNNLIHSITEKAENINLSTVELLRINNENKAAATEIMPELRDGRTLSTRISLQNLVDEFCGNKLQYPTHVGDTPQKMHPKSSLYVETLKKNCFNSNDEVKHIRGHYEANKENVGDIANIPSEDEND